MIKNLISFILIALIATPSLHAQQPGNKNALAIAAGVAGVVGIASGIGYWRAYSSTYKQRVTNPEHVYNHIYKCINDNVKTPSHLQCLEHTPLSSWPKWGVELNEDTMPWQTRFKREAAAAEAKENFDYRTTFAQDLKDEERSKERNKHYLDQAHSHFAGTNYGLHTTDVYSSTDQTSQFLTRRFLVNACLLNIETQREKAKLKTLKKKMIAWSTLGAAAAGGIAFLVASRKKY